ncbi:MAG: two pore domain potassium channel family protein [Phycisphaerales bacterium]|nr:two pore domain potassium channel family protein [Phycisphaerales bacterium]
MYHRLISPDPWKWLKNRTLPLLVALVGLIALHPLFVQAHGLADELFPLLVVIVPIFAVAAVGSWRRALPLVALFLFMTVWNWVQYHFDQVEIAKGPTTYVVVVYFMYAIWALAHRLFRSTSLIDDRVYGGLAIYLLTAIMFASIVRHLSAVDPSSYVTVSTGEPRILLWNDALYFSVTTISTLGYGDITPRSNWARAAAMLEVLAGVFITVAFIAQLITAKPSAVATHAR